MCQKNMSNLYFAQFRDDIPVIDLHGVPLLSDAVDQLEHDLFLLQQSGEKQCKIIYGIGTGALQNAVLAALEKNPMVGEVHELEGACIVSF